MYILCVDNGEHEVFHRQESSHWKFDGSNIWCKTEIKLFLILLPPCWCHVFPSLFAWNFECSEIKCRLGILCSRKTLYFGIILSRNMDVTPGDLGPNVRKRWSSKCKCAVNAHVMPSHTGPHLMWQAGPSCHMGPVGCICPPAQTKEPGRKLSTSFRSSESRRVKGWKMAPSPGSQASLGLLVRLQLLPEGTAWCGEDPEWEQELHRFHVLALILVLLLICLWWNKGFY